MASLSTFGGVALIAWPMVKNNAVSQVSDHRKEVYWISLIFSLSSLKRS
jgi:hypothetical protein